MEGMLVNGLMEYSKYRNNSDTGDLKDYNHAQQECVKLKFGDILRRLNGLNIFALLNRIKQAELVEMGVLDAFYPFTMKHLNFYCNPNHAFHRYRQFKIKKKTGGL